MSTTVLDNETEKQAILTEINRVHQEIRQIETQVVKQNTSSLHMDELRRELVRLYSRYTALVNPR